MNRPFALSSLIFLVLVFLILIFFHTRGFIPYDEGWFLQAGKRLLDGEKIYKDFEFLYNPGGAYLNALAFSLFGESILASRLLALANSVLTVFILLFISKKLKLSGFLSAVLVLIYVFWGPGHINFVWPVMLCITAALGTGVLFLLGEKSKNKPRVVFFIGIISALTFVFKQIFGVAIFVTNLLLFLIAKDYRNAKLIFWYFVGYGSIATLQALYFLHNQTLLIYIKEIYHFTVVKIYQQGILNSDLPWNYPAPILTKVFKFFFYFSPILISIVSLKVLFARKKTKMLIYFPLITIAYYVFSISPTTDYVHIAPLLALSSLPLVIIYQGNKKTWSKTGIGIILILVCLLGIYSSLFRNYYRWNAPLISQSLFSDNHKMLLWTDTKENKNVSEITNYFDKNSKNEQYIFVYNFAPAYYLLLDKKNPTRYDYLHTGVMDTGKQNEIVDVLQKMKLKHILVNIDISKEPTIVSKYIRDNYNIAKEVNEYSIWKRIK